MNIDAEHTAWVARTDQFRADAERGLDLAIMGYRNIIAVGSDFDAFVTITGAVIDLVDPEEQLNHEYGERLAKVAEMIACAVSRIVRGDNQ